jgi:MFS family permease
VDQETSPAPTLERRRSALALLCAASFLAVVDTTIVSIALPSIRRVMGFSAGGSQWVLNAYSLVFGGLLLLFGRLGDRVGRRRMFLFGFIVFLAGSVLAGVAAESRDTSSPRSIDVGGAVAVTLGLISLIFAMTSAPEHGWLAPTTRPAS